MKLSVCIPVMNQMVETRSCWDFLDKNTEDRKHTELVVVNNASIDDTVGTLERDVFVRFPHHKLINNPSNFGVTKSMQQLYEASTGDVIVFIHNDVEILEYGWDKRVLTEFEADPKLGLAGFAGARGMTAQGIRMDFISNMKDAEVHGRRITNTEVGIIFDGQCLIARRTMLDEVGGFDQSYSYHHFYDEDLSLASHFAGWTNKIIGVAINHKGGITANSLAYKADADAKMGTSGFMGDSATHTASSKRFFEKWGSRLPVTV